MRNTGIARPSSKTSGLIGILMAGILLSACAANSADPPPDLAVTVRLSAGSADPIGQRVNLTLGQKLVLTISSDRDDTVHVHGFDLEIEVPAGETVTREITMDRVGRYEVESHTPTLTLLVLQIK